MEKTPRLSRHFFTKKTTLVARELLGKKLVRLEQDQRIAGIITETEAYRGEDDLACHARAGRTPRTIVMYGLPGQVYIYFTYGIHWLLNFVTEEEGYPAAVLIRGINPTEGLNTIAKRREGRPRAQWTDGPAKICQGFNLDGTFNGANICDPKAILFVEEDEQVLPSNITISPRVGLNNVPEPWKSIPWNFKMNF